MSADSQDLSSLVAYCLGEADAATVNDVETRLAASPELRAALAGVQAMLRELEADDSCEPPVETMRRAQGLFATHRSTSRGAGALAGGMREFFARLVQDTMGGVALAGFRGAAAQRHLLFESELGEIDLRIEHTDAPDARKVIGQVDMDRTGETARVFLTRHDPDASSSPTAAHELPLALDELGIFSATVTPGRYSLRVMAADIAVCTPEFDA